MGKDLKQAFLELYGSNDVEIREFFAPGRVNIIGEHIDYNGGYVFPCALDFGTSAVVRKRKDKKINFRTLNFDKAVEINVENICYNKSDDWTNYPKGVIKKFQDKGHVIGGFDVLYYGNIPNGSGLSSSASLEVLTALMINSLFECEEEMIEIVKISQAAENEFVGVNCGIMDQFAVGMGQKDMAMLLDCNTLKYQYVPLKLIGMKIVIGNTKKRRGLADSKYNERRNECDYALKCLKKGLDINALCELNGELFEVNKHLIDREVERKRAKHAVEENARTIKAVEALKLDDIKLLGELMNQSHDSLKDLYEVTGIELDTMVEEARKVNGTIGSRMTGAGFGGCTVSIVKDDAVDLFIENVGKNYQKRTGLIPEFYIANVGPGAYEVNNK